MRNEILNSLTDTLHKRANTPLYGTFLFSWAIFHWQLLFTAFFVSEEYIFSKTGLLKNEYLANKFFDLSNPLFYLWMILPVFTTWIIVWKLPKWILIKAFTKDEEYYASKILERIRIRKEITYEETALTEQSAKGLEAEKRRAEAQREVAKIDPEVLWQKEYEKFIKSPYFSSFDKIIESIYSNNGFIRWRTTNHQIVELPQDLLAYCHSTNLIEFKVDSLDRNETPVIELTQKGKYFTAQKTQEHIGR